MAYKLVQLPECHEPVICRFVTYGFGTGLYGRVWIVRSRVRIPASAVTRYSAPGSPGLGSPRVWRGLGLGTPQMCDCDQVGVA